MLGAGTVLGVLALVGSVARAADTGASGSGGGPTHFLALQLRELASEAWYGELRGEVTTRLVAAGCDAGALANLWERPGRLHIGLDSLALDATQVAQARTIVERHRGLAIPRIRFGRLGRWAFPDSDGDDVLALALANEAAVVASLEPLLQELRAAGLVSPRGRPVVECQIISKRHADPCRLDLGPIVRGQLEGRLGTTRVMAVELCEGVTASRDDPYPVVASVGVGSPAGE
jgi:hypothetical protein